MDKLFARIVVLPLASRTMRAFFIGLVFHCIAARRARTKGWVVNRGGTCTMFQRCGLKWLVRCSCLMIELGHSPRGAHGGRRLDRAKRQDREASGNSEVGIRNAARTNVRMPDGSRAVSVALSGPAVVGGFYWDHSDLRIPRSHWRQPSRRPATRSHG